MFVVFMMAQQHPEKGQGPGGPVSQPLTSQNELCF